MKIHTSNIDTARVMSHRQNPLLTKSEWQELQYCAKVMQAIIVEYRENRDISAIFNAN